MKSKKLLAFITAIAVCTTLSACNGANSTKEVTTVHTPIATKTSPDKYTHYLKDYVGRNCASFGFGWGNQILEDYGNGKIKFNIITNDGSYVDVNDENLLSQYIVTGQSVEPNTEIKLVYETDENGEEDSILVDTQSLEEVDLYVTRINSDTAVSSSERISDTETTTIENDTETTIIVSETTAATSEKKTTNNTLKEPHTPVAIKSSPDKYTVYVKDYVGKNCALLGSKWGKTLYDSTGYGAGGMYLSIISTDGSYIDLEDEETLKKYYVTSQSVEPNTEIKLTFLKDSEGNEYDNLVDTQSIEEINLYVSLIE